MTESELPELCRSRFGGVITAAELLGAGFTRDKIKSMVRDDVLMAVSRGVYADAARVRAASLPDPRRDRLLAAAAAVALAGPRAVVSHQDAALAHGIALLDRPPPGVCAITRPPAVARGRRLRAGITSHTARLPSRHVTLVERVPVTSVERTVADLARALPFAAGVVTADSALYLGKTTAGRLYRVLGDCARWPGITKATQVVDFSHPLAESPLESISRVAFRDGGLPPPVLQAWIAGARGTIGRVDFLWETQRTIAEADGAMKYADRDRALLQLRRDTELREAGFEVVHFTWRDIMSRPGHVIAQIEAAFVRSAWLRERPRAG